jgi:hypothetical protein
VSGDTALVGAPLDDDNCPDLGSAYVFVVGLRRGDPCALATDCSSGFCADGVCCNTACDAGPCDVCSMAAGARVNGTCEILTGPCDDGDPCTQTDTCDELTAQCMPGAPVVCPMEPLETCHEVGKCDPNTGLCAPPKPDGTACDDGDACTDHETCHDGVCEGVQRRCANHYVCKQGNCPTSCEDIRGCEDGFVCDREGQCVPPPPGMNSFDLASCSLARRAPSAGALPRRTAVGWLLLIALACRRRSNRSRGWRHLGKS